MNSLPVDLSYEVPVKSTVEILQNFAAFSEYMNFINLGVYEQAKTNYGKINARKLRLGLILHAHQCRKAKNANKVSKDMF